MKKRICSVLCVLLGLLLAVSVFFPAGRGAAEAAGVSYSTAKGYTTGDTYDVPSGFGSKTVYEAVKLGEGEEIVVDGFRDDAWDNAYEIDDFPLVDNKGRAQQDIDIKASYMWDDDSLYVWAEVYDETLVGSWDNGVDWAAWGDYVQLYVDTLHTSELASKSWNGGDGSEYRGKNSNSSNYEDCAVGIFKISAGFDQNLGTDKDSKYKRGYGGAIEWQQWTWLSAACKDDPESLFTSAFIYNGRSLAEPYPRYLTTGDGIAGRQTLDGKEPIGYTFEAKICFKSSQYKPVEGTVIGAGLRVVDMTELSWWGDGESFNAYAQEGAAMGGSPFVSVKKLPNLVLLPGNTEVDPNREYNIVFEADGRTVKSYSLKKDETVPAAPAAPEKSGYIFTGWSGYSEGMKVKRDRTFTAVYEKIFVLPEVKDSLLQKPYAMYTLPDDGRKVGKYYAQKAQSAPVIDGELDNLYRASDPIPVRVVNEGNTSVNGFAYVIYDNDYIYVYVTVNDDDVVTGAGGDPWMSDSVEILVDTWNQAKSYKGKTYGDSHGSGYRPDDYVGEGQFRVNAGGTKVTGMHWLFDNPDVQKEAASKVAVGGGRSGYSAEFRLGLGTIAGQDQEGKEFGFAILINDGDGSFRNGVVCIEDGMGIAYDYPGACAKLTLTSGKLPPAEGDDDTRGNGSSKKNGVQVWGTVIAISAAALLVAGGAIAFAAGSKKKADKK